MMWLLSVTSPPSPTILPGPHLHRPCCHSSSMSDLSSLQGFTRAVPCAQKGLPTGLHKACSLSSFTDMQTLRRRFLTTYLTGPSLHTVFITSSLLPTFIFLPNDGMMDISYLFANSQPYQELSVCLVSHVYLCIPRV